MKQKNSSDIKYIQYLKQTMKTSVNISNIFAIANFGWMNVDKNIYAGEDARYRFGS